MLMKSLVAVAALASHASAFLIPVSETKTGMTQIHRQLKHQTVDLDCPGCAFAENDGEVLKWVEETSKITIPLTFDITEDNKFLQINGQPLFPPPKTMMPVALVASEKAADGKESRPLRLGYALEILPNKVPVTDLSLTTLQFTIIDLEGVGVNLDTVKVDIVQSWGHMHIARVATTPFADSPGAATCTTSICRVKAIIADRIRQMSEAAKSHVNSAKTWFKNKCNGASKHYENRPAVEQANHPHGGHHEHHRSGSVHRFVGQVFQFFIFPALFGICGGLLACAIGLAVARVVCFFLSFRQGWYQPDASRHVEEAVAADEKMGLMEDDELPPIYEDVEVVVIAEK